MKILTKESPVLPPRWNSSNGGAASRQVFRQFTRHLAILSIAVSASSSFGADYYWDTGGASAAGTWSYASEGFQTFSLSAGGGSPAAVTTTGSDNVTFSASSITEGGAVSVLGDQVAGILAINQTQALTFSGDKLSVASASLGAGVTVTINNNLVTTSSGIAVGAGSILNMGGGSSIAGSNSSFSGLGTVNLTAGTFSLGNNRRITTSAFNMTGTSILSAGGSMTIASAFTYESSRGSTFSTGSGVLAIGRGDQGGSGSMVIKSGTVTTSGTAKVNIARGSSGGRSVDGSLTVEGGVLNAGGGIMVNYGSTGTASFTQNGGTVHADGLHFGNETHAGNANFTLNGGSLYLDESGMTATDYVVYGITLTGGTLGASKSWESPLHMTASEADKTVTFLAGNSTGTAYNITLSGSLSGAASIVKAGKGSLIYNGAKQYSGSTLVNDGELEVNGTLANSAVTVSGGMVGGSGTLSQHLTVQGGGLKGNGLNVASATFSGSSTITGTSTTAGGYSLTSGTTSVMSTGNVTGVVTVGNGATLNGVGRLSSVALSGGTLKGSLSIDTLSGNGTVSVGDSPGIMTVGSLASGNEMEFNFELGAAAPDYSGVSNMNDVFRITGSADALTSDTTVNFFLGTSGLQEESFAGSFFLDSGEDAVTFLGSANRNYFILDGDGASDYSGSSYLYNGFYYTSLDASDIDLSSIIVPLAGFSGGDVYNGSTLQVATLIPEPGTWAMLIAGALAIPALGRVRRRV